jgi:hypothetical protein
MASDILPPFKYLERIRLGRDDQGAWKHAAMSAAFHLIAAFVLMPGVPSFAQVNTAENAVSALKIARPRSRTQPRSPALTETRSTHGQSKKELVQHRARPHHGSHTC